MGNSPTSSTAPPRWCRTGSRPYLDPAPGRGLESKAMQPLRLGYKASAEQFGPVELLDFSIHAEHVGFDSVVVSDHFQPWRHTGGHAPFSFAWLGALGARTRRVRMGTSVVTPTLR